MTSFPLQLINGHAVIQSGSDLILIDTGSPYTIHSSRNLEFMGQNFPCSTGLMGVSSESLSQMLGTPVTTLLGMDILSQFKELFDYRAGFIGFSQDEIPMKGYHVALSDFMKIPIIELEVTGKTLRFFLDSGAKLSYLSAAHTDGLPSTGVESDFYPGYGTFETPVYELQSSLVDTNFPVKYGNLPAALQSLLTMGNVQGIIGFDLFNRFRVMLDSQKNVIKIW
jgi:hypothetical protein